MRVTQFLDKEVGLIITCHETNEEPMQPKKLERIQVPHKSLSICQKEHL